MRMNFKSKYLKVQSQGKVASFLVERLMKVLQKFDAQLLVLAL